MTDEQKQILESFPAADRGIFGEGDDDEDAPALQEIEEDPVEAAALKAKIKQKAMKERRQRREDDDPDAQEKRARFENDEQVDDDDGEDLGDDSDEMIYDSEEEDKEEAEYMARKMKELAAEAGVDAKQVVMVEEENDQPLGYDVAKEVKKVQKLKPVAGVKFTEYDELGLPKDDGFDYHQYITTDNNADTIIDASPDLMEAAARPTGERFDIDKDVDQMNDEEKAAFDALSADDGAYEELEDDFLFLANEG